MKYRKRLLFFICVSNPLISLPYPLLSGNGPNISEIKKSSNLRTVFCSRNGTIIGSKPTVTDNLSEVQTHGQEFPPKETASSRSPAQSRHGNQFLTRTERVVATRSTTRSRAWDKFNMAMATGSLSSPSRPSTYARVALLCL